MLFVLSVATAKQVPLSKGRRSCRRDVTGSLVDGVQRCVFLCSFLSRKGDLERCPDDLGASGRAWAVVVAISALACLLPGFATLAERMFPFTGGPAAPQSSLIRFQKAHPSRWLLTPPVHSPGSGEPNPQRRELA